MRGAIDKTLPRLSSSWFLCPLVSCNQRLNGVSALPSLASAANSSLHGLGELKSSNFPRRIVPRGWQVFIEQDPYTALEIFTIEVGVSRFCAREAAAASFPPLSGISNHHTHGPHAEPQLVCWGVAFAPPAQAPEVHTLLACIRRSIFDHSGSIVGESLDPVEPRIVYFHANRVI